MRRRRSGEPPSPSLPPRIQRLLASLQNVINGINETEKRRRDRADLLSYMRARYGDDWDFPKR